MTPPTFGELSGNGLGPWHPGFFAARWGVGSHLWTAASHLQLQRRTSYLRLIALPLREGYT